MSTPTPDLRRLNLLLDAVRARPEPRFSMKFWMIGQSCGTVCCAVGSYLEAFPESGLRIDFGEIFDATGYGYEAVARHFGITINESAHLFAPKKYEGNDKASVIARIEQFIADKTPAPEAVPTLNESEPMDPDETDPDTSGHILPSDDALEPFDSDFGAAHSAMLARGFEFVPRHDLRPGAVDRIFGKWPGDETDAEVQAALMGLE